MVKNTKSIMDYNENSSDLTDLLKIKSLRVKTSQTTVLELLFYIKTFINYK